jgi:uncharacterized protein (DUF2235 family)
VVKSRYNNFAEYELKDANFLIKVLKDELYKTQAKIEFKDGSTYHVTKSGSRYWEKNKQMHREDGPSSSYMWSGEVRNRYYLFSVHFEDVEDHTNAVVRLNELRTLTDGKIEGIVEEITKNISYDQRGAIWRTLLSGKNDDQVLLDITALSQEYVRLTKLSTDFVSKYSTLPESVDQP